MVNAETRKTKLVASYNYRVSTTTIDTRGAMTGLRLTRFALALAIASATTACQSAQQHAADVTAAQEAGDKMTVGTVQKEIHVGMSGADVAAVLGSPNIVTTDENRREVWIYDKISTTEVYSTSAGGVSTLIFGGLLIGNGLAGGAVRPSYYSSAGAASRTQKTLTVIIKFDEQKLVRDFAYHSSSF